MSDLFGGELPEAKTYTVLARKYRPSDLDGLIGQEALVRTLRNAMKTGRLAHAFLLTGIRGVGKTTTARIIARALNNIPADQTVDQHIDVVEMDAASNTGVDDVREIIDAAKYKPLSAPYKIYIIDEVHMLSKGAFNALLKTLEEPPPHVKFIFATTEIRKIPVTILSRCQRFDLKRVETDVLAAHLTKIAGLEGVEVEEAAIRMVSVAAEGSVRDSLSLLDQAIAYSEEKVTAKLVQEMLGYADKTLIISLFEQLFTGKIADALELFANICQTSAEPTQIFSDLLEFSHLVTRFKVVPNLRIDNITEAEVTAATKFASQLTIPTLTRIWQLLLKAHNEIKYAPNPKQTGEMALVRIAYASELPDPSDLIRDIKKNSSLIQPANFQPAPPAPKSEPVAKAEETPSFVIPAQPESYNLTSFADVVDLFRIKKEFILHNTIKSEMHLVSFKPEKLEIRLKPTAPKDLTHKIATLVSEWTGSRWMVAISSEQGEPTLEEQEKARRQQLVELAKQNNLVQETLAAFPDSQIKEVRKIPTNKAMAG